MLENIPQKVYELALKKDLAALRALEARGACLTQCHFKFDLTFNAISKLAFDGHSESAEFLVDQLIGNVDDLVFGYAKSGQVERTLYWISRGGCFNLAIYGLASAGGCDEVVEALIGSAAANITQEEPYSDAVKGYAERGDFEKASYYRDRFAFNPSRDSNYIRGCAHGKHLKEGLAFINDESDRALFYELLPYKSVPLSEIPPQFHDSRLFGAAFLGDEDAINTALKRPLQKKSPRDVYPDFELFLNIAKAYENGGHFENAAEIMRDAKFLGAPVVPQNVAFIITATRNGHIKKIADLLDYPPLEDKDSHTRLTSPYAQMAKTLSTKISLFRRELLMVSDRKKRERLYDYWVNPASKPDLILKRRTLQWLGQVEHVMTHTGLGYDCARLLADNDYEKLTSTINLITVSLHKAAGISSEPYLLKHILGFILQTDDIKLTKIHTHFSALFSHHRKPLITHQETHQPALK